MPFSFNDSDVIPALWDFIDTTFTNNFLQPSKAPAAPVTESQSPREPGISVPLVVRNTQRWGSTSIKTVMGPISKTRMVSGGSLTCPQLEKYMLCTFRKKLSTRNPWPLHQDSMARLSTQSFSLSYLLQKNIRQRTTLVVHFTRLSFITLGADLILYISRVSEDLTYSYSAQLKRTNL